MFIQYLAKPEWIYFHPSVWHKEYWHTMLNEYRGIQQQFPDFIQVFTAQEYNSLKNAKVTSPVIGILVCEKPLFDALEVINKGLNQGNKHIVADAFKATGIDMLSAINSQIRLNCNISDPSRRDNCTGAMYMSAFPALFKTYILERIVQFNFGLFNKNFTLFNPTMNSSLNTKNLQNPIFKQNNNTSNTSSSASTTNTSQFDVQNPVEQVQAEAEASKKNKLLYGLLILIPLVVFFIYKKFIKK